MNPVGTPSQYLVIYRERHNGVLICTHTDNCDECVDRYSDCVNLCYQIGGMAELWELMPDQLYNLVDSCHMVRQPPFLSNRLRPSCN